MAKLIDRMLETEDNTLLRIRCEKDESVMWFEEYQYDETSEFMGLRQINTFTLDEDALDDLKKAVETFLCNRLNEAVVKEVEEV